LTDDEKFDILHLLVKKVVYFEDSEMSKGGSGNGKIKLDLWELPPINPAKKNSAKRFAESNDWLPFVDDIRTFLSSPNENFVMISMLKRLSFLNA